VFFDGLGCSDYTKLSYPVFYKNFIKKILKSFKKQKHSKKNIAPNFSARFDFRDDYFKKNDLILKERLYWILTENKSNQFKNR
jgi:hypothetical protein